MKWAEDPRTLALVQALEDVLWMVDLGTKDKTFDPPLGMLARAQADLICAKEHLGHPIPQFLREILESGNERLRS